MLLTEFEEYWENFLPVTRMALKLVPREANLAAKYPDIPPDEVHIFCDGSVIEEQLGFSLAVLTYRRNLSNELGGDMLLLVFDLLLLRQLVIGPLRSRQRPRLMLKCLL